MLEDAKIILCSNLARINILVRIGYIDMLPKLLGAEAFTHLWSTDFIITENILVDALRRDAARKAQP